MKAHAKTLKAFKALAALFAAALALVCAGAAAAQHAQSPRPSKTVESYRVRVRSAAVTLESLASAYERPASGANSGGHAGADDEADEDEDDEADRLDVRRKAALDSVRALLPAKERLDAAAGAVEVDNSWLHAALGRFEEAKTDDARADSLRSTAQRLRALESRLAELEGARKEADDRDAERGRLNAILRGPEFNRPPQGNALERLMEEFADWFSRRAPKLGGGPAPNPRLSLAAQVVVITLCVAVLAYVLGRAYRRRAREVRPLKLRRRPRVVLGERLEADATPADLLDAAEGLARAGDLRGAIRKAYVALLVSLGDAGLVRLAQNKTNRDYLEDARRAAAPLYEEMLPLTRGFEQHWYGLRDATAAEWDDFRARCRRALRRT